MKQLTRLGRAGFNGFSPFRWPRSIGQQRSVHLTPSCGHPTDDPPAAAAGKDHRNWVLLNVRESRKDDSMEQADAKATMAESQTSTGKQLRVSFGLAPPPLSSYLYYDCDNTKPEDLCIITAHGDSVLLVRKYKIPGSFPHKYDHFVYRAGAAGARLPSLSRLPPRDIPVQWEHDLSKKWDPRCRPLINHNTCLLRQGEDDLLVAQLDVGSEHRGKPGTADLCVLRPGRSSSQWELHQVPIILDEGEKSDEEPFYWSGTDKPIAVGHRFIFWADYDQALVCDMADDLSPKLSHVPLPVISHDQRIETYSEDLPPLRNSRNMGAAGNDKVRLVSIEPRCCCGGTGRSSCARARFAFTVTTWTLTLKTDDEKTTWVKDGVLDCEELWALPGYENLPRRHLKWPVVSLDNPDVVSFIVLDYGKKEDRKHWMIEVDMRRKVLSSAVQCTTDPWKESFRLPVKLQ